MKRIDGVSRRIQQNSGDPINHGYIAIPEGVEREAFVETCFRRNRVTIITDYGSVINECYILKNVLQEIDFPKEIGSKGSCVCYVCGEFSNKPIVIGVIDENDQTSLLQENMFNIHKKMNGTDILIQGDPNNNSLTISVVSKEASQLSVMVNGNEENALNIESSGSVNVTSGKSVNVKSFETITGTIFDVEKQEDIHSIVWDKSQIVLNRKTENIEELIQVNDEGVSLDIKDDMSAKMTKTDLNIKTGQSTLLMNSDIISFNGGGLDGLVKINELTTKLNDFVNVFNSHVHNVPAATFLVSATAGVPNPAPIPIMSPTQQAQTFNKDDYENDKITQG